MAGRRLAHPVAAATGPLPAAPFDRPLTRLWPYLLLVGACVLASPYLGLTSFTINPHISEVWPPAGVVAVGATLVWRSHQRLYAGLFAAVVVVFTVTAALTGDGLWHGAWWGVSAVVGGLAMMWLYRRQLRRPGWVPDTAQALAALLFAALASSVLVGLIGGYPHVWAEDLDSPLFLWWVLRNAVFCYTGAATFMFIFYWRRPDVLPRSSWLNLAGLTIGGAACVFVVFRDPHEPLSWLFLVPSVWAGLSLTPKGCALVALWVALGAAFMPGIKDSAFDYGGILPPASVMDILIMASTTFALLLSLMRDQRARLIQELQIREQQADHQSRMLETVFQTMTDGAILSDPSGVEMHNVAARRLLARPIPMGEPISWNALFGIRTPEGDVVDDTLLRSMLSARNGESHSAEFLVGHDDGARHLEVSTHPMRWGERDMTLTMLHDVSTARERIRELMDFAGVVAHDMRGPLTGLSGWLEAAQDSLLNDDDEGTAMALSRARLAAGRMQQVISDWLNYTVVRDGELKAEAVDLHTLAREVARHHRNASAQRSPEFDIDVSHTVHADPVLLRQLLDNLVGNAVKYTEPGTPARITITSRDDDEHGWVRVEIADEGIGIPVGQEELIFREFHRGPDHYQYEGTGLGLALTRRIVLRHGGQVTATRNPGTGSTFTFTLPMAATSSEANAAAV